jgi:hypothetical protein
MFRHLTKKEATLDVIFDVGYFTKDHRKEAISVGVPLRRSHNMSVFFFSDRKEASFASTMIMEDLRGQPPAKRMRREYRNLQERLRTLCQDRLSGRKTVAELLRGAGHNIRWNPTNRANQEGDE